MHVRNIIIRSITCPDEFRGLLQAFIHNSGGGVEGSGTEHCRVVGSHQSGSHNGHSGAKSCSSNHHDEECEFLLRRGIIVREKRVKRFVRKKEGRRRERYCTICNENT